MLCILGETDPDNSEDDSDYESESEDKRKVLVKKTLI